MIKIGFNFLTDIFTKRDMRTVVFDLFGTLIDKYKYHYDEALQWLAHTYFEGRCSELQALSLQFKNAYMKSRLKSNRETSFFSQLQFFENELNTKIYDDYQSVELNFIRLFRKEKLIDGACDLLLYLYHKNLNIYVLTNSLFSGNSLKAYLRTFGIDNYIRKVYSSADIGFRKPAKEIFNYTLTDIGINTPSEVYYIGDSFEKDYRGAKNVGITPILIGHFESFSGLLFDDLSALFYYFQKYFDDS